jgi:hypothetical protein
MGFDEFTPEEIKTASDIGDRASAAADSYSKLDPSSRASVVQALSGDPPSTDGLDGPALDQVKEEIDIRKAKADFMNSVGFDIDPLQSFDLIFKDKDGNVNTKNVQKTQDLLEYLGDQQTKDPSFLDKVKAKFNDKAQNDPKNASKYGNWAGAITALASAAAALLAFLKNKNDLDALRDALKAIAAAMSGCFAVDVSKNTNKLLSCDKGNDNQQIIAALQAACTNTTYKDLTGKCTDVGNDAPPLFSFVYKTYTVGDLLADVIGAIASIPKDISNAVTWLWDKKWYIVGVFVAILIAIVGFGFAKRYALSNASPPT